MGRPVAGTQGRDYDGIDQAGGSVGRKKWYVLVIFSK